MTPRKTTSIHPPPGGGPYGVQVIREPVRRSWLVVSSMDEGLVAQAWTSGADVIVLDLEDSVHDSKKPLARERIPEAIPAAAKGGAEVFVRPDIEMLYADLEASIMPGVTGVVLPKVSSADQVREAEQVIVEMEQRRGMPGVIELHLSLETGPGGYYARAEKKWPSRSVSLERSAKSRARSHCSSVSERSASPPGREKSSADNTAASAGGIAPISLQRIAATVSLYYAGLHGLQMPQALEAEGLANEDGS